MYAHGNGTLKSNFYDAFVSITRGLFNTRSRPEHTRKRKIVSHIFSQKSVLAFEPHIRQHVQELIGQWDKLCEGGRKGASGIEGEGGWRGKAGRVWFDCLPWYNYLAFDIIGDLAFGSPFGMIKAAKDAAPVAVDQREAIASYGKEGTNEVEKHACAVVEVPAVQILNDRGEYSASMGVLPPWCRPLVKRIPWYAKGNKAVKNLAGLAVAAVSKRLALPTDRTDLLSKLQDGKDDDGNPMGREELTAEALTQLIAGSDTTSKYVAGFICLIYDSPSCSSSCAITYHLAHQSVCASEASERARRRAGIGGRSRQLVRRGQEATIPPSSARRDATHSLDVGHWPPPSCAGGRSGGERKDVPRGHGFECPELYDSS